jgi:hypothetical protein
MCASAPNGPRRNWHPVTITHTLIGVSGGWEAKAHKANSIDVTENHKVHTFVELDKNSPWFLKGVAGPAVQKGGLKPVQVMNAIRHKAIERDTEAAVAEAESAVAANGDANAANHSDSDPDDDPMDQLDDVMETKPATKTKPTPKRTHAWGARSAIVCVDMPARPPCLGLQHVLTQPIWVYRKGKHETVARKLNRICICERTAWIGCYHMQPTNTIVKASHAPPKLLSQNLKPTMPQSRACESHGTSVTSAGLACLSLDRIRTRQRHYIPKTSIMHDGRNYA